MDNATRLRLISAGVSAAVTAATCPLLARHARRWGMINLPNERSSHEVPTPRSGGLACTAGLVVASLVDRPRSWQGLAARAATLALAGVGLVDDRYGLSPGPRFAAQVTVGAMYGATVTGPVGAMVGAAVLPATVNATNFMDGINGMTAGTVLTWAANHRFRLPDSPAYRPAGASPAPIAAAALGFLPFNVPSAKLFLGDSGSYLFGAAIGTTLIADIADGRTRGILATLAGHAPLAVYFADTGATLVRRATRGAPLTQAHREHIYQRVQGAGPYPHWAVSLFYLILHILTANAFAAGHSRMRTVREP